MFYPLTSEIWGEEEEEAINRVVRKRRVTMGEEVSQFEKEFALKMGSRYAVMVNSGSSANLIATAAFFFKKENPLQRGDEVIVPSISWATTYYPLQQYGLKLCFVDIELDSLNMDVSVLEAAITPKTKMLVGVNILGNPSALDVLREFCHNHRLYFLEDNCESMGAELGGKKCGTFGDVGTFSTFFSHHISTMEGGIIVTDDKEMYELCVSLRAHGWTRNLVESELFEKSPNDFYEAYRFILPGYNVRPLEISAAIGREQLKKLDKMVEIRRKNAVLFQSLFKDDYRYLIQKENGKSSWFCFTIIVNPLVKRSLGRANVLEKLKEAEIEYRIITGGNFLRHDVIKYFEFSALNIVNANFAHDRGFFVGNHPMDLTPQLERLYSALRDL